MRFSMPSAYIFVLVLHLCPRVVPDLVNQTIDDRFGDSLTGVVPHYLPVDSDTPGNFIDYWTTETCAACTYKPDADQAYKGTYSVTSAAATGDYDTRPRTIKMQFTGIAIYVFFILANFQIEGVATVTNANFTVDGQAPVLFTQTPANATYIYHALVFAQTNLSNTLHNLSIATEIANVSANASGPAWSTYINFDYAIYTSQDNGASSSTTSISQTSSTSGMGTTSNPAQTNTAETSAKTPTRAIIGGIAGGVVTLVFVLFLLFRWRWRRSYDAVRRDGGPEPSITVFDHGAISSTALAPGVTYTHSGPVHSKAPRITPRLVNQTGYNSTLGRGGIGPSPQNKSRALLGHPSTINNAAGMPQSDQDNHHVSHPNTPGFTREEVRRERQEELDHRLRMVQQSMSQVTGGSGEQGITEAGGELSISDIQAEVQQMREQIQLLRQQQQSAWAQGLSDDPPPGYTPA